MQHTFNPSGKRCRCIYYLCTEQVFYVINRASDLCHSVFNITGKCIFVTKIVLVKADGVPMTEGEQGVRIDRVLMKGVALHDQF
jgi:hypothetical protein